MEKNSDKNNGNIALDDKRYQNADIKGNIPQATPADDKEMQKIRQKLDQ